DGLQPAVETIAGAGHHAGGVALETPGMKRGLNHAPLPQPLVSLRDEDAIPVPLREHLHRPGETTKLFRFADEDFSNGVRVKEDVGAIGTQAKGNHVAVAAVQLRLTTHPHLPSFPPP